MSIHLCNRYGNYIRSYDLFDKSLIIYNDEYIYKKQFRTDILSYNYSKDIDKVLTQYPFDIWEKKLNAIEIIRFFGSNKWRYIE